MAGLEKVQEWTERLERFAASSLTVAQFCEAEGVSQQSYYHWKRRLRADGVPTSGFRAVQVSSATTWASQPTTVQLGGGVCIELGDNLQVAELVVNRVLHAVVDTEAPAVRAD